MTNGSKKSVAGDISVAKSPQAIADPFESAFGLQSAYTVLVVDDQEANRSLLADHLELMGLSYIEASNGAEALDMLVSDRPDLVLLDLMMPIMDGHAVLDVMQADEVLKAVPVIVISGKDDEESIIASINCGAEDYLTKPFNPRILRARVENCLAKATYLQKDALLRRVLAEYNTELKSEVSRQVRAVAQANASTVFALSTLAESRDPETGDHLDRMRNYCRLLAVTVGETCEKYGSTIDSRFADRIYVASPLHDIGKVAIPDGVLLKPGQLTPDEFDIMKQHCVHGANTLQTVLEDFPENELIRMGLEIALGHHEKWDGSGYPHGIAGEKIPLSCRIVALADVYDALTSKRCYKDAFTHEKARDIIVEGSGKHFDSDLVEAFLHCEDEFDEIRERLQPTDAP